MASHDGITDTSLHGMSREELLELIADMRHDWAFFNQILNTMANSFGWCAEFEDRMNAYNSEMKVLQMRGRADAGKRVSTRNAYAARRMSMGHIMTTCQRLGVGLPDVGRQGIVADHEALDAARDALAERLQT